MCSQKGIDGDQKIPKSSLGQQKLIQELNIRLQSKSIIISVIIDQKDEDSLLSIQELSHLVLGCKNSSETQDLRKKSMTIHFQKSNYSLVRNNFKYKSNTKKLYPIFLAATFAHSQNQTQFTEIWRSSVPRKIIFSKKHSQVVLLNSVPKIMAISCPESNLLAEKSNAFKLLECLIKKIEELNFAQILDCLYQTNSFRVDSKPSQVAPSAIKIKIDIQSQFENA